MNFREFLESWSSFKPGRQREFPFRHEPGYDRKAHGFLEKDFIDPEMERDTDFNLYHVTTNLPAVKASGGLKSRSELGIQGLGGGGRNEAPNMVSTTYDYSKALKIYEDLKTVAEIVAGKVPASHAFAMATEHVYDPYETPEIISVLRKRLPEEVFRSIMDGELQESEMDRHIAPGEETYEFLQELEDAVTSHESQSDDFYDRGTTGFTAPFEDVARIRPQNVAIIQIVARKGAKSQHVPGEKEIRFKPEDLRIIRFSAP
jgi:hypothetical protein